MDNRTYRRIGTLPIEEVMPLIGLTCTVVTFFGFKVRLGSSRILSFKVNGITCVTCGVVGQFFAVEQDKINAPDHCYHLNLYAINHDGNEVLMTRDHITPRSLGGDNSLENSQTMCTKCNGHKSDKIEFEEGFPKPSRPFVAKQLMRIMDLPPDETIQISAGDLRAFCIDMLQNSKTRRSTYHYEERLRLGRVLKISTQGES